jgi:poly-gamma-glutamate capsule biosynthesis protein CapA/YwtB (metallophosphatase superfamily)
MGRIGYNDNLSTIYQKRKFEMYKGTVAVAGECMCTRPFSMHKESGFLDLLKVLRDADTAYCHFEMNLLENGSYPGRAFAVSALQAEPIIANELKWAGIDLVSCAYNHALDWGMPGLLGTMENLSKAGIVHAGLGNNLEEAREPAYFESPAGRVAIISISTGHHPYDSASPCKAPVRGRPGVNPLRVNQKYVIDKESLEKLQEIWKKVGLSLKPRHFQHPEKGDVYFNVGDHGGGNSGNFVFRAGDKPSVLSFPNQWDIDGNLRAIKDARRQSDLVMVAHHAAINDGERGEKPCKFVPPFAKQCIDAGADLFIGHGWHKQLGIEIYKNRPIFYGTGNFFAQSQFLKRFPADTYEGHGFSLDELPTLTPADLHESRAGHMAHWNRQPWGIVASLKMDGEKLKEIKLYPFTIGYDFDGSKGKHVRETGIQVEGRPILADKENGEKIIGYVKRLSAVFNTRIEYKNGIGVITVK